ncbi:hypothetical protein BCR42DRAFT_332456 [Absidia repens]|uniref:Uncharacterized protein n=1 Tax=Absidia repens TaxID=90262 RepID=A0A1X2I8W7_9FUNG|nr:hypothetical protein BCR42DRAFT_332456 [Absidia repens]
MQQQHQQHASSLSQDTSTLPIGCPTSDHSTLSLSDQTTSTSSFSGLGSSSTHSTISQTIQSRSIFDNLDVYAFDVREYGLPFENDTFEFVMQRLSTPAYSSNQWKCVVGELVRVTRPGGYLQFIEIDYNSQNLGPAGQAWQDKLCEVMAKTRKLDPHMASHVDEVLEEYGLVNVEKKKISMPLGPWGLDIGVLWQQNLESFIEASAPALGMALGISAAECKVLWQGYKDELNFVKAFTNVYAVTGQKPHLVV